MMEIEVGSKIVHSSGLGQQETQQASYLCFQFLTSSYCINSLYKLMLLYAPGDMA